MNSIVGVISDTHGLLRPEVPEIFRGVNLILHAGDIGSPEVLKGLETLAPVVAVRGNNDKGAWAGAIPEVQLTRVAGVSIYMLHDLKQLKLSGNRHFEVVVSGHSHRPLIERKDETFFVNPGSAGPRRFRLPISVALLTIENGAVSAQLIELRSPQVH